MYSDVTKLDLIPGNFHYNEMIHRNRTNKLTNLEKDAINAKDACMKDLTFEALRKQDPKLREFLEKSNLLKYELAQVLVSRDVTFDVIFDVKMAFLTQLNTIFMTTILYMFSLLALNCTIIGKTPSYGTPSK